MDFLTMFLAGPIDNDEFDGSRSDIDSMPAWVIKSGLLDRGIGYAVRRIAENGTMEQMIAFVTALRAELRRASTDTAPSSALEHIDKHH